MLLLDLPTELLTGIAGELVKDGAQGGLAALALSNRLFNTISTPLLYRSPKLVGNPSSVRFFDTLLDWCGTSSSKTLKTIPIIKQLSFADIKTQNPLLDDDGVLVDPDNLFGFIGLLDEPVKAGLFEHVRSLSFTDADLLPSAVDDLIGPRGSLRNTIESLTLAGGTWQRTLVQWLFLYLHFFPSCLAWRSRGDEPGPYATLAEREAAKVDVKAFRTLTIWSRSDDSTERLCLAQPPTLYPFTALKHLHLRMEPDLEGHELFLIFVTNLFPALAILGLEGHLGPWAMQKSELFFLRRSVHRTPPLPPATFLRPQLIGNLPPADVLAHWWDPLSAAEVASSAFTSYRGPNLSQLDLSKLTIDLVE